jgi:hypothetical protein
MIRFDGWAANYSQSLDGIQQPVSGILSCDADGFTVGSDAKVNYSGGTYHYLCIADNGGGDAVISSYAGNGSSPRNITTGFAPQFVLAGQSGGSFCWKIAGMGSVNDLHFGYSNPINNEITAMGASSFTVEANRNTNGATYWYLAMAASDLVWVTTYVGDGVDNRNITGCPFQPDSVWICQYTAAVNYRAVWKLSSITTADRAMSFVSNEGYFANAIQALNADGFQVGTDNAVNKSGGTYTYAGLALKSGATASTVLKTGADLAAGTDTAATSQFGGTPAVTDSGASTKDEAGYWREVHRYYIPEGPHGPPFEWVWYHGVEAEIAGAAESGGAIDSAAVVVNLVAGTLESAAGVDATTEAPPVTHIQLEAGAGLDTGSFFYDLGVKADASSTAANDSVMVEINPIAGTPDAGTGADQHAGSIGLVPQAEVGAGAEAAADLRTTLAGSQTAAGAERATRIAILSRHIIECSIESSLDALADGFDLTLVESDPSDPLTPKAQAWRLLGEGDLVQLRLGLAGLGFDDYGVFRIDSTAVRVSERQILTELHGRDQAALLIEEYVGDSGGAQFAYGAYPEQDPIQLTRPNCSNIACLLADRVGLGLVWDAPDYPLKEFAVRSDESVSGALNRLLGPLQVSRQCRTDAWVDGDNLIVRRRGNGPVIGALDCGQGLIRSITRERQPAVGEVIVLGGTEVIRTTYLPEDHGQEKGSDKRESQVEIEDDGSGHRVVRTYLQRPNGIWVQTQEEVEDQDFQEVWDGDRWIGRVLLESRTTITTNMHLSTRKTERRITHLSYDGEYRLIRREESKRVYNSESHEFELKEKSLVRFEQITPTDVRTTSTEWKVVGGELKVKSGYPTRVEQPGTLQSALHVSSSPDHAWDQKEDGSQPQRYRAVEQTRQYQGSAMGIPDGIPREHSDANLMSDGACQQIAEDMACESGQWLYQFELFWPRPFPYRKGDCVTLTDLPADMDDVVAIITGVRTRFSVAEAAWTHDISLEAWAES